MIPVIGGALTLTQILPATNGTLLYNMMINKEEITTGRYVSFYAANTMVMSLILYPLFHVYNLRMCERSMTPTKLVPPQFGHFAVCYSLMTTTVALD